MAGDFDAHPRKQGLASKGEVDVDGERYFHRFAIEQSGTVEPLLDGGERGGDQERVAAGGAQRSNPAVAANHGFQLDDALCPRLNCKPRIARFHLAQEHRRFYVAADTDWAVRRCDGRFGGGWRRRTAGRFCDRMKTARSALSECFDSRKERTIEGKDRSGPEAGYGFVDHCDACRHGSWSAELELAARRSGGRHRGSTWRIRQFDSRAPERRRFQPNWRERLDP